MNSREPTRFLFKLFQTPHIISRTAGTLYAKHVKAKMEYKRSDGYTHIPIQQIGIRITNICNLRCKTCGQWGETGYNLKKDGKELTDIVPVQRYIELADEVKKYKPIYYIWGGEPFLYPGLFEFTHRIKENGSLLAVVTNATFLTNKAEDIISQKWDALMFSLDGPEEIHDKIRGKKGTFKKIKEGILAVKEQKKKNHTKLPWIMALVTISVDNAGWVDKIFETGQELGVDCIIVYYSWFTEEKVGKIHTRICEKKLGITPEAWRGYLFDHHVDIKKLSASLQRIQQRKWSFPYLFIPELKLEELESYYSDVSNFFGYGPCISPWYATEIKANGDVAPCRDYPDFIIGNIKEESLIDLWNNDRYKKFRRVLKECGGTFPICSRCCGLMGW